MKKILPIILFIGLITVIIFVLTPRGWKGNLLNPIGKVDQKDQDFTTSPTPIPTPNAPKTFQFDSSTDLKMELENINPQVLDSDFE